MTTTEQQMEQHEVPWFIRRKILALKRRLRWLTQRAQQQGTPAHRLTYDEYEASALRFAIRELEGKYGNCGEP